MGEPACRSDANPRVAGGRGRRRSPLRLVPAPSQRLVEVAGPGWIAAGDAACSFDPLASMGIGHAIASGIHAARVAHDSLTADGALLAQYARGVDRNGSQYLDTRERYYSLEPRFAGRPFWARRQDVHPTAAESRPPPGETPGTNPLGRFRRSEENPTGAMPGGSS
jgi:hypothetical protein